MESGEYKSVLLFPRYTDNVPYSDSGDGEGLQIELLLKTWEADEVRYMSKPMVWIVSYFAGGPSYCPRIPDYSLAKYLREHGYDALVFAGSALHNTETNFITDKST